MFILTTVTFLNASFHDGITSWEEEEIYIKNGKATLAWHFLRKTLQFVPKGFLTFTLPCSRLSPTIANYRRLWPTMADFGPLWPTMANYGRTWVPQVGRPQVLGRGEQFWAIVIFF
jgi:hypothetical protein